MSKFSKVVAYLNKPVSEVIADIGAIGRQAALAVVTVVTGVAAATNTTVAHATIVADATAGIDAAKADTLSVGGVVVIAVAALMVVGWIISMMRKH